MKKFLAVVLLAGALTIQEVIDHMGRYDSKIVFPDGTIGLKYESRNPDSGIIFIFDKNGEYLDVKPFSTA